jgi:hypothetical protein
MVQSGFHLGYLTSLFIVGFIADHFGAKRVPPPASPRASAVVIAVADGFEGQASRLTR